MTTNATGLCFASHSSINHFHKHDGLACSCVMFQHLMCTRQYCTRRLARLHKFLNIGHGSRKFVNKEITPEKVTDERFLHISLLQAERVRTYLESSDTLASPSSCYTSIKALTILPLAYICRHGHISCSWSTWVCRLHSHWSFWLSNIYWSFVVGGWERARITKALPFCKQHTRPWNLH